MTSMFTCCKVPLPHIRSVNAHPCMATRKTCSMSLTHIKTLLTVLSSCMPYTTHTRLNMAEVWASGVSRPVQHSSPNATVATTISSPPEHQSDCTCTHKHNQLRSTCRALSCTVCCLMRENFTCIQQQPGQPRWTQVGPPSGLVACYRLIHAGQRVRVQSVPLGPCLTQ